MHKVIISNGVFRFHLVSAAVEAARRGALDMFLTGAYPTGHLMGPVARWIARLSPPVARFLDRASSGLPESRVRSVWLAELFIQSGVACGKLLHLHDLNNRLQSIGLQLYGWLARRPIARSQAQIYHYRAGYGGSSVDLAKRMGMLCLCDHSIASPLVLEFMVDHGGVIPTPDLIPRTKLSPMWKRVMADIDAADHVLVNSEFVRTTLMLHRTPKNKISVVYQGLDEKFVDCVPPAAQPSGANHILFAGEVSRRKGFDLVIQALEATASKDWVLTVAGGINEKERHIYQAFLSRSNVLHLGFVSRQKLAELMSGIPIFLFPSLAEGSARVVFEALACGCYVITTPNAGSVVEDGVHGALVPPGDAASLRLAIEKALSDPSLVRDIGVRNRTFVRDQHSQDKYGDQLNALYGRLLVARGSHRTESIKTNSLS
ncbi:glycosyltransferase family 4 protein [Paraburkholderia bengalensis]|uniref:Glycosyltransferase family 4 protein n=1 Tax=Paraburkholderia bengalensis TaxID=2747562 RepID=A0ABU8IJJ8_9BURK